MSFFSIIVVSSWVVFLLVWGIGAFNVKKDIMHRGLWGGGHAGLVIRALCAVVLVALLVRHFFYRDTYTAHRSLFDHFGNDLFTAQPALQALGALICVAGIALAIFARFYLGRNWSSHPALKAEHELVTGGPYAYVRHPIYTGLLLAVVGSALTSNPLWLLVFVPVLGLFLWRIPVEEKLMREQFPNQYPAYQKRTKALIPFVW